MAGIRAESLPRVNISTRINRLSKSVGSRAVGSRQYFGWVVMAVK